MLYGYTLPNDLWSMTDCTYGGGPKDCDEAECPMGNGRTSDSGGIFFSDGSRICGDWPWVLSGSWHLDSEGTGDIPVRQPPAWLSPQRASPALPTQSAPEPNLTLPPALGAQCCAFLGEDLRCRARPQAPGPREPSSHLLRASVVVVTASCGSVEPVCP